MAQAKLSKKYQVVIPREIRRKLGLEAGSTISLYPLDDKRAVLVKQPKDYVAALEGLGADIWKSLGGADNYIKEERASWGDR